MAWRLLRLRRSGIGTVPHLGTATNEPVTDRQSRLWTLRTDWRAAFVARGGAIVRIAAASVVVAALAGAPAAADPLSYDRHRFAPWLEAIVRASHSDVLGRRSDEFVGVEITARTYY
jgi:hypothetical protein